MNPIQHKKYFQQLIWIHFLTPISTRTSEQVESKSYSNWQCERIVSITQTSPQSIQWRTSADSQSSRSARWEGKKITFNYFYSYFFSLHSSLLFSVLLFHSSSLLLSSMCASHANNILDRFKSRLELELDLNFNLNPDFSSSLDLSLFSVFTLSNSFDSSHQLYSTHKETHL